MKPNESFVLWMANGFVHRFPEFDYPLSRGMMSYSYQLHILKKYFACVSLVTPMFSVAVGRIEQADHKT